jgi:hypothetical protein
MTCDGVSHDGYELMVQSGSYVEDMLALVAFPGVWTVALRNIFDMDGIDVACTSCKVDNLLRALFTACMLAIDNTHP